MLSCTVQFNKRSSSTNALACVSHYIMCNIERLKESTRQFVIMLKLTKWNVMIYSRWIFRYRSFVGRHILDIICVQPLDLEVKVHVGRGFAETVLFMLLQCVFYIYCKQTPHCGC